VWVYWQCDGRDDVARILDMSMGGVFLDSRKTKPVGTAVNLDFLVPEGRLRADAVVQHVESGRGLGLKFTAVSEEDRPHLAGLLMRLRELARSRNQSK
jgi:hypothetical protein